jgi:H+/Cl- antiporter ClcA
MGVILGISGVLYNLIMVKAQDLYKSIKKIPNFIKMPIIFIISGAVGLVLPQVLCGGHSMVEFLLEERPSLSIMLLLLSVKFVFGAICFASGAPGGTLYPLCILGTYIGAAFGSFAISTFNLSADLWQEFVVIGMAGLFSSIVRSPITGIILVFELTGNMNNLLPLATVSLISYATANLIGVEPFYEILMSRIVADNTEKPKFNKRSEKVIKSFVIPIGSKLDKKKIKDIEWGRHALIITVERGEESITPNGDVELHAGDEIVFLVSQRKIAKDTEHLETLFE